ncbi:MAG TPA: glycoside hydrolase family 3 N-terminal domain-containing protein, partial [Mycobacteriales bacterium]|nr:glycoside hydrolase family 3 N-terminal domain-containing protein [Mycobacteriales bacterium]
MSPSRALTDADLDSLVEKLDLETKVRLLSGAGAWTLEEVPEIGLRTLTVSDGPVGVRGGTDTELEPSAALPSGSAMAATWDEDLLGRIGGLLAAEAVRKGVDVVLGPTINLHRYPLGGRHFECFAEDPLLSGRLATAYVRGVQEQGIGACPKHYVANDAESDRFTVDNRVDERTLRELYLAPFEAVVTDADPWMVMAAYNAVNGTAMTENDLLAEPLKGEWGFDGAVVSDWGAVYDGEPAA